MKNVVILLLILSFFKVSFLFSQQASVVAGGLATGSGGTVSYSIGHTIFTVITGANGNIAQGVQQPFEISFVIVGVEEIVNPIINWVAFPNPTKDIVKLKTDKIENQFFQLVNLKGEILIDQKIVSVETVINMKDYPPATYLLKVFDKTQNLKTVKIIKY